MNHTKKLGLFALTMMNILVIDGLRSVPINAEYGYGSITILLLGTLGLLIPVAIVSSLMVRTWPKESGGIYIWARELLGHKAAIWMVWAEWISNVVWYPTALMFLTTTSLYLISPQLIQNKLLVATIVLSVFWLLTLLNCFGIRIASIFHNSAALLFTLIPMLVLIGLGFYWALSGQTLSTPWHIQALWPHFHQLNDLLFLTGTFYVLVGMDVTTVHAPDVERPAKTYPRAFTLASIIIVLLMMGSAISLILVVPHKSLSSLAGLTQALEIFLNALHLQWLLPLLIIAVVISVMGGLSVWILGPSRSFQVAAHDHQNYLAKTNRFGAPSRILLWQAILTTLLSSTFVLLPTVKSIYWVFNAMTAQIIMIYYVIFYALPFFLYRRKSLKKSAFAKVLPWLILGIITAIGIIIVGFIPPAHLTFWQSVRYEGLIALVLLLVILLPLWFLRKIGNYSR